LLSGRNHSCTLLKRFNITSKYRIQSSAFNALLAVAECRFRLYANICASRVK
jgi:hypothetical protein